MNIPMAYDVVPADGGAPNGSVNPGALRSPASDSTASVLVAGSSAAQTAGLDDSMDQPLLLSSLEQQWSAEMAAEGLAHLPLSWFRQTPKQAVWGAYGVINRVIGFIINFGLNVGIGYAVLSDNDEIGLWQKPDAGEKPSGSAAWADLLITTFLITWLTSLISTNGIRKAMKQGQTVPVDRELLQGGWWRCVPVNLLGTCSRSLLLALWAVAVLGSAVILLFEIVCVSGGMHGSGAQCSMNARAFIFVKATYAGLVAWTVYPLILLQTLNTATLPPLDLTFFAINQKERWEKRQRDSQPEPL